MANKSYDPENSPLIRAINAIADELEDMAFILQRGLIRIFLHPKIFFKELFGRLFKWLPRSRTARGSLVAVILFLSASAYLIFYGEGVLMEKRVLWAIGYLGLSSVAGALARITWRW